MDWLVFGDDWGAHPSTTQHLVRNLPDEDRVVWVDSIGMRSPKLRARDISRAFQKVGRMMNKQETPGLYGTCTPLAGHVRPKVLPWHTLRLARWINAHSLASGLCRLLKQLNMPRPTVLASSPVPALYLDHIPHGRVAYLRLDDYSLLPGCDRALVQQSESAMMRMADRVVTTARKLLPTDAWASRGRYLPQGTDTDLFGRVSPDPPRTRILGFFGLLAEWIDYDLIARVARAAPEWQLEFIGPVHNPDLPVFQLPNVTLRPGVPFTELPRAIARWSAAWAPFEDSELTQAVNPLKVREYLAAGLPTHCTPLPEVEALEHVFLSREPEHIAQWLRTEVVADSRERRLDRQGSVRADSWQQRTETLRRLMSDD